MQIAATAVQLAEQACQHQAEQLRTRREQRNPLENQQRRDMLLNQRERMKAVRDNLDTAERSKVRYTELLDHSGKKKGVANMLFRHMLREIEGKAESYISSLSGGVLDGGGTLKLKLSIANEATTKLSPKC
eukprot:2830895-Prymnesium_polylepis.1